MAKKRKSYSDFEDFGTQTTSETKPDRDVSDATMDMLYGPIMATRGEVSKIAKTLLEAFEDHVSVLNRRIWELERNLARFSGPFDRFIEAELQNRLQLVQSKQNLDQVAGKANPSGKAYELLREYDKRRD
jgi:hypothetical protein